MTAYCHPMPHQIAEEMLQVVARAICDRPGESPAQRESRTHQMVHSVTGLTPRDGLEYMLSSLVVGHFNLILDSLHEVFAGQADAMKARTKSTIVAFDRAFIGMIRELRLERARPMATWAAEARPGPEADVAAVEVKRTSAGENAALVAQMALALREEAERDAIEGEKRTAPVMPSRTSGSSVNSGGAAAKGPMVSTDGPSGTAGGHHRGVPPSLETGKGSAAEQLADFEKALVAMTTTLDRARAPEHANGKARVGGAG